MNADFQEADVAGCDFGPRTGEMAKIPTGPAKLRGADFREASLDGTILNGVDLRRVQGLTLEQLQSARLDKSTRLPRDLERQYWGEGVSGKEAR